MIFLKNLTISICVLSLMYFIIMLITPDRYKRQLRSLISIIAAVTIGGIVLGADFSFDGIPQIESESLNGSVSYADQLVISELEKRLEEQIGKMIQEAQIPMEKISVETNIDDDNCIFISKISMTIGGSREKYEAEAIRLVETKIGDISIDLTFSEDEDGA